MAYTAPAAALRDELLSKLKVRLPALAKVASFSAVAGQEGSPVLLVGPGTAGSDSALIRFTQLPTLQKDVLGLPQNVFTPHRVQVVFEADPAAGAGADIGTWATKLQVLGYLIASGVRVEVYFSAVTVAVSEAAITGAPVATFDLHEQYPLMGI